MRALQRFPVPVPANGCGFVRGLGKRQQCVVRHVGHAYGLVRQDEFSESLVVVRLEWLNLMLFKSLWFRVGVCIKGRLSKTRTWPEPAAAYLVRIGLTRDKASQIRHARMLRSRAAGKAGDRQIEATPKEVHGAYFADKSSSELRQHSVGLQ